MPFISIYGILATFFFLLFSLIGRFLFPFGDEPDFTVRAPRVIDGDHFWWSPYSIFHEILQNLQVSSSCRIDASPVAIWGYIDSFSCTESIEQILIRFFITIVIASPLFYAIIFRKSFVKIMKFFRFSLTNQEWENRLNAISISLIFPSIVYYLGVMAEEQFTLILSLIIFLFWGSWIIVLSLIALIMSIDIGNSMVVFSSVVFAIFFGFLAKKINIKVSFLVMGILIVVAFVIGFSFLTYLENISFLASKAEAMYSKAITHDFLEKYPLILRPIVTFMTGTFMTPSGLKVIPLYILIFISMLMIIYRLNKQYHLLLESKQLNNESFNALKKKIILSSSAITTILFFVFLFPDYGNAKYYVFLIPFVIALPMQIFNKLNILKFIILLNLIVFINLILYRF